MLLTRRQKLSMEISRNTKKKISGYHSPCCTGQKRPSCFLSESLFVLRHRCTQRLFPLLHPHIHPSTHFPGKGLPGTPHGSFLITTSSLSDIKKKKKKRYDWSQTSSSSPLLPAGPSDQNCFDTAAGSTQAGCLRCSKGGKNPTVKLEVKDSSASPHPRPRAALAVLTGKPGLGRIKLTHLHQHSLRGRLIAVQAHPEFLSLPVSHQDSALMHPQRNLKKITDSIKVAYRR